MNAPQKPKRKITNGNSKNIVFQKDTGSTQQAKISTVGDDLRFTTGTTTERMRIDSNGVKVNDVLNINGIYHTEATQKFLTAS